MFDEQETVFLKQGTFEHHNTNQKEQKQNKNGLQTLTYFLVKSPYEPDKYFSSTEDCAYYLGQGRVRSRKDLFMYKKESLNLMTPVKNTPKSLKENPVNYQTAVNSIIASTDGKPLFFPPNQPQPQPTQLQPPQQPNFFIPPPPPPAPVLSVKSVLKLIVPSQSQAGRRIEVKDSKDEGIWHAQLIQNTEVHMREAFAKNLVPVFLWADNPVIDQKKNF
jgi:hypothetical protein